MSFSQLATVGTLSYNGYTFDGASAVKCAIEFVQDEAKRTVLYHRHLITVKFYVQSDTGTDGAMLNLQNLLSKQGEALVFRDRGFSTDLVVNQSGTGLRDVKFGPIPKILHWEPIGSAQACECEWEVETCIPVCDGGSHRVTGVMSINYEVSFSIEKGFTTRTITGFLEVAMTRLIGTNVVPDCADLYRQFINPGQLVGFERTSDWHINFDKSRIEFTIVDRQHRSKNVFPVLTTAIEGSHRVVWSRRNRESMTLRNNISLNIETTLGAPPALAWNIFGQVVRERVLWARNSGWVAFLDEVVADEDLFSMSNSFSASYRLLVTPGQALNSTGTEEPPPPPAITPALFDFSRAGLWRPLGGTQASWQLWQASMSAAFDNRGFAGLVQLPGNDAIIDLCSSSQTIPFNGNMPPAVTPITITTPSFANQYPPPKQSFIGYSMNVGVSSGTPVVRQSTLQAGPSQLPPAPMQGTGSASTGAPSGTSDSFQAGGIRRFVATIYGQAERVGYEIARPALVSIGGQQAFEESGNFLCKNTGLVFGVPVYRAAWAISYVLGNSPGFVRPRVNLES